MLRGECIEANAWKRPFAGVSVFREACMLVEIDERYCIGCGRCVDDCVGANLEVEGVTA